MRTLPQSLATPATVLLLVALQVARAENTVEFSEVSQSFTAEGISYNRLVFKQGNQGIFYEPPRGWRYSSNSSQLSLVPADKSLAEAKIESLPARPQDSPHSAEAFKAEVLAKLPPRSEDPVIVSQQENALQLNNNPTAELVVSYGAFGHAFQRSVLVVNTPTNQIRFQFTSLKSDFVALYRAFRASVLTWEWQPMPAPNDAAVPAEADFRENAKS